MLGSPAPALQNESDSGYLKMSCASKLRYAILLTPEVENTKVY